jgi:Ca-activated chloride channel family protein
MKAKHLLCALPVVVAGVLSATPFIRVTIREPVPGQPAIGNVEVVADVLSSEPIVKVEFVVDGTAVGSLTAPPYRLSVELGSDNVAHDIEVIAHDSSGNQTTARVDTAPIPFSGDYSLSLQQLYITATEGDQRILDLAREELRVFDEGIEQEVVSFEHGDVPFTAVLLIDASSSMRGARINAARAGALEFVHSMQELDRASLIAFADRVLAKTSFDSSADAMAAELAEVVPWGGTAIHDHLYMAIKLLEQRQGRRVVVLLSDGIDAHSVLDLADVFTKVRRSQTIVYWIWLNEASSTEFAGGELRTIYSTWHTADEYREQIRSLRHLVEDTGGKIIRVESAPEIAPVFQDILAELRDQYVVGYYPSNNRNDGAWHQVRVRTTRPAVSLRTHDGYIDF